jgi:hypothetical protein
MRSIRYFDFDLLIEPAEEPYEYEARVIHAPSGEYAPVDFRSPFSDIELENFLLKIGRRRNVVRGVDTQGGATVQEFGSRLFDSVFQGDVRVALATSLSETDSDDLGLRLRLRLNECPELADLAWEYLYDSSTRRFLALSEWTPVVRYLDLPGRVRPLAVNGPLRVLGMVSSPTDYPQLSVNDEWSKLETALSGLVASGRVELTLVPDGTLASLNRALRREDFHVFHYIGHGGFLPDGRDGVLILEDGERRGLEVSGLDLGVSLHDHRTLRLAVLNSCEGARAGVTDPYSGTAQTLVQQGIPAVVAMQFEISDEAAITFSHVLYEAIADGYPLDASMAEARKAVRNQPNATEWGTPVLYLRAPDGRIFDMSQAVLAPPADRSGAKPSLQRTTHVPIVASSETDARPSATEKDTTEVAESDELEPGDGFQTSSQAETATTSTIESTADADGRGNAGDTKERDAGPAGPPGSTEIAPRRPRWIPGAAIAVTLLIVAGVVAMVALRSNDQERAEAATSPFEAGLFAAASPYFPADACREPTPDEAPLAAQLPLTQVIKCDSGKGQYTLVLWCTDTDANFAVSRRRYLDSATDTPIEITSTPAGQDVVTDGVQQAYHHSDGDGARVYWDSPSALCGAELQSTSTDVGAAIDFWHNGAP